MSLKKAPSVEKKPNHLPKTFCLKPGVAQKFEKRSSEPTPVFQVLLDRWFRHSVNSPVEGTVVEFPLFTMVLAQSQVVSRISEPSTVCHP